jgi:hypothetical protein
MYVQHVMLIVKLVIRLLLAYPAMLATFIMGLVQIVKHVRTLIQIAHNVHLQFVRLVIEDFT